MLSEQKPASSLKAPLRALFYLGFAVFFFIFGYTLGEGPGNLNPANVGHGNVSGLNGPTPEWVNNDVSFKMFWDVWSLIQTDYVDHPVPDKDLFYGSLEGLVNGLHDPYSTFFSPEKAQEFNQQLNNAFSGIGAEIGLDKDGNVVVIAPIKDTPADKAGLQPNDIIVAIDGADTYGWSVNEAVEKIRGQKGTTVVLTISRADQDPFDVSIVRDDIHVDSVTWNVRDDGIGVIGISVFNDDTAPLFSKAVQELQDKGVKKIVVDLRNNPGGLLDAAINLAGYWVGDKVVVIEDNGENKQDMQGVGVPLLADTETVVLVNGGSASASEILSGALQDYHKAEIIGEQTFGKGSVQEYHDLPDGSAVKITVARWLTPLGRSIDKQGITPDDVVSYTLDDAHANTDPQLKAAIDYLTSH